MFPAMPAHIELQSCRLLLAFLSKGQILRGNSRRLVKRAQRGQVRTQSTHNMEKRSLKVVRIYWKSNLLIPRGFRAYCHHQGFCCIL